jgi:GT2 family glycosyltransferase
LWRGNAVAQLGRVRSQSQCYTGPMQTTSPGYFIDSIGGQPWYRCQRCPYDGFLHENIRAHVQYAHGGPIAMPAPGPTCIAGHKIAIGLLTWNTCSASICAATAIRQEIDRLIDAGAVPRLFWVDNGSTDDTVECVRTALWYRCRDHCTEIHNADNLGQSVARNSIIAECLAWGADYLLMVDGDIEIVPGSALSMGNYLETASPATGCVGVYCRNCTHVRDVEVATEFPALDDCYLDLQPAIAWTNYGMFRRSVLETCKFDTSGPFAGPGWGFEDDDYYMQMVVAGYCSLNTKYVRHMHRRRHSSLRALEPSLAAKVFRDRQQYMIAKWGNEPLVADRIRLLANQTMPVVDS